MTSSSLSVTILSHRIRHLGRGMTARWGVIGAGLLSLMSMIGGAIAADDAESAGVADPKLQKLYRAEAERWEMWADAARKRKAEMLPEPVFRWQNLARERGQSGEMYLWVLDGRPAVIGGVFSNPSDLGRDIMHEFHVLGTEKLSPVLKGSTKTWQPKAGVNLAVVPDSPTVEEAAATRTVQLRNIARDFAAETTDLEGQRWTLRLLTKPLYRYESPRGDVLDGAVFAFVSDAGTDPEIILMLEGRKETDGAKRQWYYRAVRLSISDLRLDYKGNRVWSSPKTDLDSAYNNKDFTYHLHWDRALKTIPE